MKEKGLQCARNLMPVLILVLLLVLCISVISMVLLKTISLNQLSETHNALVQLARNTAEEYRAGVITGSGEVLFFDEFFKAVEEDEARFTVHIDESSSKQNHGSMKTGIITVMSQDKQVSYALTVNIYCPNGGAQ